MAAEIGARIAFYRDRQGLSAQQLADLCAQLGMPSISRVVITKLENGRREAVSTAELQVLSAALGVPAILLLFPLGRAHSVEALPGVVADPWYAFQWFTGAAGRPQDPDAAPPEWSLVLTYWLGHDHDVRTIRDIHRRLAEARRAAEHDPVGEELVASERRHLQTALRSLWALRRGLARDGLIPPALSPDIAVLLDNFSASSARDPLGAPATGEEAGDGSR